MQQVFADEARVNGFEDGGVARFAEGDEASQTCAVKLNRRRRDALRSLRNKKAINPLSQSGVDGYKSPLCQSCVGHAPLPFGCGAKPTKQGHYAVAVATTRFELVTKGL